MEQTYNSTNFHEKLNQLKNMIDHSPYTVIFSGAGMSTEAGLPDFRSSSTGIWKNINPMKLASARAMYQKRDDFVHFYRHRVQGLQSCRPHIGHILLANWEKEGRIQSIITQNVDGFHHNAGSQNVIELHGTLRTCHCQECGKIFNINKFLEDPLVCGCGGFIRPSVVLFGESLPDEAMERAEQETKLADLFIVMGSSLMVSPANLFPIEAKRHGAKLVILNMEQTELDYEANLVIHGEKIGKILQLLSSK